MAEQPKHSPWGMSSAHRYFECPASVAYSQKLPPREDTEHADRGTAAHLLGELTLRLPPLSVAEVLEKVFPAALKEDKELYAKLGTDFKFEEDEVQAVRTYVRHVRQLVASDREAQLHLEVKFTLATPEIPEADGWVYGRCDAIVYLPGAKTLHVIDYKHGVGVDVQVEGNKQLMGYGAGAVFALGVPVNEVVIHIVQPRSLESDEPIKTWGFPSADLIDFRGGLVEAIHKTLQPNAPTVAGDHCHFCRGDGVCPARASQVAENTGIRLRAEAPAFPDVDLITDEQLARIVLAGKAVRQFIKAAEAQLTARLKRGQAKGLGVKLVNVVPRRAWKGDVTTKTLTPYLRDGGVPPERFHKVSQWSPAEVDGLFDQYTEDDARRQSLKAAVAVQLVTKESPGLTIAPMSDRREEINFVAAATAGLGGVLPPPQE